MVGANDELSAYSEIVSRMETEIILEIEISDDYICEVCVRNTVQVLTWAAS